MSIASDLRTPPLTIPRPRVVREWGSTRDPDRWPDPPRADGRPAMLIPGFLAGDASLTRMAVWLRTGGFKPARSGVTWNVACMEETLTRLEQRLEASVEAAEQPALLVGQSRGGTMARALAARRPDLVDTLITLGSPVLDQLAVHRNQWVPIGAVGLLGTIGVPGFFGLSCIRGDCCAQAKADLVAPFPDDVEYLAVFSRSDEVVRWQACVEPAASAIEVASSHVGMGFDVEVWRRLAQAL